MKSRFLIMAALLASLISKAQTVTFSEHIAPIIYNHCTTCHRSGEVAPFPLTNFQEVSGRGDMIKYVTGIGYMPPWKPNPQYRKYQKENYLSATQKQLISDWVNAGMPQGNIALEPVLPVFPSGSQVGVPDLVVSFAKKYTHAGDNTDEYRYFVLPTGLTSDKKIRSMEFRPGNKKIVHHALVWEDTTGAAAAADALTPEYGYAGGGSNATDLTQQQLPGYVPGAFPVIYSNGITQKLHAGGDLKVQVHFAPTPVDELDSSSINIFFDNGNSNRLLQTHIMLPLPGVLVNGPFYILANTKKQFHGRYMAPSDLSLYSVSPHCHKLGTHWKVYAIKPTGDTIPLIHIPSWDFNWQGSYQFKRLIRVPQGSVIHAFAGYDNTTSNVNNPNNPPTNITWGEGTADEMYYLPISFLPYQAGDEDIVLEDEVTGISNPLIQQITDKLYPVAPVPSSESIRFGYTLATKGNVGLRLFTMDGKLKKTIEPESYHLPGYHTGDLNVSDLPAGVYFLEFTKGKIRQTQKVVVGR